MKDMEGKVYAAVMRQCENRGYAAPVDVLMDLGLLERKRYDDWRAGKVPYLEAVCHSNLHKLTEIMKTIRKVADQNGLKPSVSAYKHKSYTLRFSKSGEPGIEKAYATHYISKRKPGKESP